MAFTNETSHAQPIEIMGADGSVKLRSLQTAASRSLAARLDGRNTGKIKRQFVGLECFHFDFDQTDERAVKIWFVLSAAIDNDTYRRNDSAMSANNVNGLLDAAATCDYIFSNDKFFALLDSESAAKSESSRFFLGKNVAFAQRATDFLADNDSAERGRDHGVAFEIAQTIGELAANVRGDVGVLQQNRTLKVLPAVQSRAQDKMAIEQRAGFAE
jgi:hypothetical protein